MKLKSKQLKEAAKELNEAFGLKPAINLKGTDEELLAGIKEALLEKTEDDTFTEGTQAVIDVIEAEEKVIERKAQKAKSKAKSKAKKLAEAEAEEEDEDEPEDEPEEDPEEEEEEEEAPVKPAAKKDSKKPAPAPVVEEKKADKKESKKPTTTKKEVVEEDDDEVEEKPKKNPHVKVKEPKGPSAYGTAIELMCKTPDQSIEDLKKGLEKKGIKVTTSNISAIRTAFGTVRKIVSLLRENKLMK
jgi:outer membrane biosynthesis protein TonB